MQLMLSFVLLVSANLAHAYIDINLQMQLGNPSSASTNTKNHDHFLIQRTVEALDYNDNKRLANCASWDLTAGDAFLLEGANCHHGSIHHDCRAH